LDDFSTWGKKRGIHGQGICVRWILVPFVGFGRKVVSGQKNKKNIHKQIIWESGLVVSEFDSRSIGCGFKSCLIQYTRRKWCLNHVRINFCTQFWFSWKAKKIQVAKWGTPTKKCYETCKGNVINTSGTSPSLSNVRYVTYETNDHKTGFRPDSGQQQG